MTDKYEGPDRRATAERREHKVRFDPSINLGHVLTFIGFLIAGFGAWSSLDKRIVVLEEGRNTQQQVDRSQDSRVSDAVSQIKDVLLRLDRQVERLNDKLDKPTPR